MKQINSYLALMIVLLFSGCTDNKINPLEEDSGVYSFYGALEVGKSPNVVRVKDLNEAFLSDSAGFNGTVTFQDLETGEVITPRDSVVQFTAGFTHNFIIENEIEHNKTYLLTAERPDGLFGRSVATTPAKTEVVLLPDYETAPCEQAITFRFNNVVAPEFIDIRVSVLYDGDDETADMRFFLQEFNRPDGEDSIEIRLSPLNLLVEVFPPDAMINNPLLDPYSANPTVGCSQLDSNQMDIIYTHYGGEWSVARPIIRGLLDFDSGDVENGLGFFGGFYRNTISIIID